VAKSRLDRIRRTLGGETTLEGVIDAMGKEREEQVLERLAEFADQVVVIAERLQEVVRLFTTGDHAGVKKAAKDVGRLESRADDCREAILDRVSLGGVFPMHRADLARLVSSIDNIANLASGAADRISMRSFSLPPEMNEQLVELARVDLEAGKVLREAVVAMSNDLREAIKLAGKVDKLESQADEIFASLYRTMFDMDIDFKTFHQLKAIIDRLENMADRCSQNAELLRHMALEYLEEE